MMKKTVCMFFALVLALCLSACAVDDPQASDKTFEKNGLTVTLTRNFSEKDSVSGDNLVCYYESGSAFFLATKEMKDAAKYPAFADFAAAVAEDVELTADAAGASPFSYGYYSRKKGCTSYGYMLCLYEGSDRYYVVNIGCKYSRLESLKEDFLADARSVSVV